MNIGFDIAAFKSARVLAIAAIFWAGATTPVSSAEADAGARVVIKNFMFSPVALTVKAGSVVSWTNQDNEPHTIASDAGVFRSGALDTNDSFTFKFDKPGTYRFLCSIHPYMVGTITVEP
jgi:plastocyanin